MLSYVGRISTEDMLQQSPFLFRCIKSIDYKLKKNNMSIFNKICITVSPENRDCLYLCVFFEVRSVCADKETQGNILYVLSENEVWSSTAKP